MFKKKSSIQVPGPTSFLKRIRPLCLSIPTSQQICLSANFLLTIWNYKWDWICWVNHRVNHQTPAGQLVQHNLDSTNSNMDCHYANFRLLSPMDSQTTPRHGPLAPLWSGTWGYRFESQWTASQPQHPFFSHCAECDVCSFEEWKSAFHSMEV